MPRNDSLSKTWLELNYFLQRFDEKLLKRPRNDTFSEKVARKVNFFVSNGDQLHYRLSLLKFLKYIAASVQRAFAKSMRLFELTCTQKPLFGDSRIDSKEGDSP